ncbi:MAG: hypothetical protein QOI86_3972 [Actinomycetota bacterium]|nr:hypothetical protein [Actinomycetota bacterium]
MVSGLGTTAPGTRRVVSDIWAPVIAALGSAIITAGALFGIDQRRARRQERAGLQERRRHAYSRLLTYSGVIAHTAGALHTTIQIRSGIREGLDVTLGKRVPMDPMDVDARLRQDFIPLSEAWSDVWTIGSSEAVIASNWIIDTAAAVVGAATTTGDGGNWLGRLAAHQWTDEQLRQWNDDLKALAIARRNLAELARRELGIEVARLFSEDPVPGSSTRS